MFLVWNTHGEAHAQVALFLVVFKLDEAWSKVL